MNALRDRTHFFTFLLLGAIQRRGLLTMASEYRWYIEDHIIYAQLIGRIAPEDLQRGNMQIGLFLEGMPRQTVHLIYDARAAQSVDFSLFQARKELHYLQHPALNWLVTYGATGIVGGTVITFSQLLGQIASVKFRNLNTFSECLRFLRIQDPDLPEFPPLSDVF